MTQVNLGISFQLNISTTNCVFKPRFLLSLNGALTLSSCVTPPATFSFYRQWNSCNPSEKQTSILKKILNPLNSLEIDKASPVTGHLVGWRTTIWRRHYLSVNWSSVPGSGWTTKWTELITMNHTLVIFSKKSPLYLNFIVLWTNPPPARSNLRRVKEWTWKNSDNTKLRPTIDRCRVKPSF